MLQPPDHPGRVLIHLCRPCNAKELYNLHHAQLRNVIEHIFGVLKNRFRIIRLPPEYKSHIQARIPPALCFVHNVIRIHDPDKLLDYRQVESNEWRAPYDSGTLADGPPTEAACIRAHDVHDEIAQSMWGDYLAERQRRGASLPSGAHCEM